MKQNDLLSSNRPATAARPRADADMLYAFTGVRGATVGEAIRTLLDKRGDLEAQLVRRVLHYPMESLAGFLLSASAAFYLAERHVNPKIKTFVDAMYYISTCLSVGYADIFAQTQTGRAIATLVMALGPALTSSALDLPGRAAEASALGQEQMVDLLDAILQELRRQ